ncbi:hypothetical protein SDC9_170166 [bioreactor metagenome]|uniref:Peptidase U32 collagenase domain-containing protein n=1 Tax=bioreactor metagenome TaxID=1076179 RepID=A0A645G9X7_9ZZZZ
MPSIYFDSEKEAISVRTALLSASGVKDVLAGSPSYVTALAGTGMKLHGGYRLNIINSLSAEFYASAGFCDLTVSPELSDPAVSSLASPVPLAAMICGRLPLMLLQSCVIANETGCDKRFSDPVCGASCRRLFELRDRTGARFTAVPQFGHRNAILNSQLSYRADTLRGRADIFTVLFTTESDSEALCLAKLIVSGGKPESYTRR